jgi:hypothetical protein
MKNVVLWEDDILHSHRRENLKSDVTDTVPLVQKFLHEVVLYVIL